MAGREFARDLPVNKLSEFPRALFALHGWWLDSTGSSASNFHRLPLSQFSLRDLAKKAKVLHPWLPKAPKLRNSLPITLQARNLRERYFNHSSVSEAAVLHTPYVVPWCARAFAVELVSAVSMVAPARSMERLGFCGGCGRLDCGEIAGARMAVNPANARCTGFVLCFRCLVVFVNDN